VRDIRCSAQVYRQQADVPLVQEESKEMNEQDITTQETALMGPVLTRSMSGCSLDDLRALLPMINENTFCTVFETLFTFEWWSDVMLFLPVTPGDRREVTFQLPDPKMLTLAVWVREGTGEVGLVIKHGAPPWRVIWQRAEGYCTLTQGQVYDLFASMGSLQ